MNQIEFLLRLSQNAQDKGDEIATRHNAERDAHIKELLALEEMIEAARRNVHAELQRFGVAKIGAQPQHQLSKAAT